MTNDFAEVLVGHIQGLALPFEVRLGYLDEMEGMAVYPLPGGKVDMEYMDGTREVSLPFEVAVKGKNQEQVASSLWAINEALSDFDLSLPSQNDSYNMISLEVAKPFLNDLDEQGFYIFMLDVVAHLEIPKRRM